MRVYVYVKYRGADVCVCVCMWERGCYLIATLCKYDSVGSRYYRAMTLRFQRIRSKSHVSYRVRIAISGR